MGLTEQQTEQLNAKLDPKHVKKPSGSFGPKGDYIEGWHAIAEANRIFGFDGWTAETVDLVENHAPVTRQDGKFEVSFRARVRVIVSGITRDGVGFGSGFAKNIGDAYEGAIKEAETDAFKRAMRTFGNVFGLALYDKSQANVGVDKPRAVTTNNQPSGTYRTPKGYDRKPGERLDPADSETIRDTLLRAMELAGDIAALDGWAGKQVSQIETLTDVDFDTFRTAFLDYRMVLRNKKAAA